ncbi:MAG: alpha/beta hydrolase [Candidatus Amoebophilus sp. 36-38]|mgnify:CR=1 FL=1|nr:MAG: alpha/beta hydrolase [Candidatus Amoebophilus sp. 36-38]
MNLTVRQQGGFNYIEEGQGEILVLLHGLFGALSNWEHVVRHFSSRYRVIIPLIPIYEVPLKQANVAGLVEFIKEFIQYKALDRYTLVGNSLGGHIALIYTLENPNQISRLVLTASSGLYENAMGGSFIKRSNYDYIAERVRYTFYDPAVATKEYIDEVFDVVQDRDKAIRIAAIAKSAQRQNLADRLPEIEVSTLLIWGLNDTITPPLVAHEFNSLMPNSCLRFIDKCCHAPMMEHPAKFNDLLDEFLIATT